MTTYIVFDTESKRIEKIFDKKSEALKDAKVLNKIYEEHGLIEPFEVITEEYYKQHYDFKQ